MSNKVLPRVSGIYKYARLVNNDSKYANRMNRLSNAIFTEVVRKTDKFSKRRVVDGFSQKPNDLKKHMVEYYYPRTIQTNKLMKVVRDYGLFRDEHQDFLEEMERLRQLRGKGKQPKEKKSTSKVV